MRLTSAFFMLAAGAAFAAELELAVVDLETGDPIAQADVRADVDGSQSSLVTGANGLGAIPLPASGVEYSVILTASAEGYVPTLVHWEVSDVKLPKSYTLRMERGTSVAGAVAYDDGDPIEGASVRLFVNARRDGIVQPAITDLEILTDAEGKWHCDVLPKSLTKLQVRVSPPGGSRMRSVTFSEGGEHAIASLRDGSAVIEISRRFTLAGIVRDASGEPIAGARLVTWPAAETADRATFTQSGRDGTFEFDNVKTERMMISTVMDGMAPDMSATTPGPDAEPVEITLKPGHTVRGQVTTPDGEPIEDVTVAPHTWLGQRVFSIEMKTDDEGRFVWDGAPEEGVVFEIRKPGYAGLLEEMLFPSEDETPIVLNELLRIGGSVVDDETGEPLEGFKVFQGIYWESADDVQWSSYPSDEGYKGEYELYIEAGTPAVQVRVEADGYLPVLSRIYHMDEGYQRFDVRMKKGSGPSGIVRAPDGSPAAGVSVYMTELSETMYVSNGNTAGTQTRYVQTGDDGRYEFAPLYPEFRLAVIDELGFAVRECELGDDSYDLTLDAAGAIEGTVTIDGNVGRYESVTLSFDPRFNNGVQLYYTSYTDPDGRFVFQDVPAGEARLQLMKDFGGIQMPTHGITVWTKTGETTTANIGGEGKTIVGKVEWPDDLESTPDLAARPQLIYAQVPNIAVPSDVDRGDAEAMRAWQEHWQQSDEARARRAAERMFAVGIEQDGSFRVSDIPAGDYSIMWQFVTQDGQRLGKIAYEFKVPAGDGLLDLGTLEMAAAKNLKIGDEAPLFEAESLDGAPVRLEDFRGQYVLLDFWATWCGPCIGETPHLVETFKRFGNDERFAMIGLSLDDNVDAPLDYTTKNEMAWTQLFLGEWNATSVPEEYGVEGIPTIMLLDPQGNVIETGLRGSGIADAVAKYLE